MNPVPFTRSFIQIHKAYNRPISAAGGSILLPGPFPADGLSLRFRTDFAMTGHAEIDFRQVVADGNVTEQAAQPRTSPLAMPAEELECRCKSLLWGHSKPCPFAR